MEVLNLLAANHTCGGNAADAVACAIEALALPESDLRADSYLRLGIAFARADRTNDAPRAWMPRRMFERGRDWRGHLQVLTEVALPTLVAEVVSPQVLIAELTHDLVPTRRVPENRRRDPATARSDEQPSVRVPVDRRTRC